VRYDASPISVPDAKRAAAVRLPRIAQIVNSRPTRQSPRRIEPVASLAAEDENLLLIYRFMSRGERRERFVDVRDPSILIDALIAMMERPQQDQTFANLEQMLRSAAQQDSHLANGMAFLTALSGSNNEFAASRKVVFFARRMIQGGLPLIEPPRPQRRAARPRTAMTVFFGTATQTSSMTQSVLIVRDAVGRTMKPKRVGSAEARSIACQAEALARPTTMESHGTLSYPYGAVSSGFATSKQRFGPRPTTSPAGKIQASMSQGVPVLRPLPDS
jgi:hypothetical protein